MIVNKYFFDQDSSSHWYMIPVERKEEWDLLFDLDEDDPNTWELFEKFSQYRTGGGINDIEFSLDMPVSKYAVTAALTYTPTGDQFRDLTHYVSALAEEAGEACSILKRHCRGDFDFFESPDQRQKMMKEIGDVLWYVNAVAMYIGSSLEEVMNLNNEKTLDRLERNVIKGKGDER